MDLMARMCPTDEPREDLARREASMDWSDSPEQAQFRTQVRDFVRDRLPDYYREQHANRSGLDSVWQADRASDDATTSSAARDWAKAPSENGWVAPNWPDEYGGAGLSVWEQFIFKQEMAEAGGPPVGGPPVGGQGVTQLGPTLIVHGNDEQKAKYLSGILAGDTAWCQGYSEPGAGSDLASVQTRAVRDGDEYVINGQKIWTSNAHNADNMYILVRTDPDAPKHRGISLIIIADIQEAGVQVRPLVDMTFKHHFNETFFEDVRAPVSNRIGEENRGWYVGMTLLDYERSNIDSALLDRTLVEELIEYLNGDEGSKRSRLPDLPSLRAEVADRYVECDVARNFGMRIASMQASGIVPNYESSTGKMFGTETHQRVQRSGMRALGLYGNIWGKDSPYASLRSEFTHGYVRSIPATIGGGSSEIQRNIIATRGLGLPRG